MIKNIKTLMAVCVLCAASASATNVTIGEPNTSVCYPFSCNDGSSTGLSIHYQQVFSSGLFPTAAISINNISFGVDGFTSLIYGQGGTVLNGNYQIAFSTTNAAVGGLSPNLNANQGLDQTVFYNNNTISGFTAAPGSPLIIAGGSSFVYNPLAGNLLMDIIVTNQAFLSSADAGSFDGSASFNSNNQFVPFNTSSVFMIGNQTVVTGAFGLVTTFDFSAVNAPTTAPEIGSILMVGFGVAILLYAKRRSLTVGKLMTHATGSFLGLIVLSQSLGQAQESLNVRSVVVPPHSFGDQKKRPVVTSKSPLAVAGARLASTPASLPVWSSSFTDNGSTYNVWFAGSNPSSNTTTNIETNIVPVRIVLCNDGSNPCTPGNIAYIYDPVRPLRNNAAGVTLSAAAATLSSPVFQNATYATAGTTVGTLTQYSDAMMRASFWNYSGNGASANPNWHTRLQYSLKPPVTITIPTGQWDASSAVDLGKISLFQLFQPLDAESSKYSPGQFTFFLLYNVVMTYGASGPCCVLGYHTSDGLNPAPSRTYGVAGYLDATSKLPAGYFDTGAISHEIVEWIHNPFLSNTVPLWAGSGGCYNNMEVADPLEDRGDVAFKVSTFGRSYNVVNTALAPWFMKGSFGVNGFYTYKGAVDPKFTAPATCP